MNKNASPDYAAVLEDLIRRRATLDAAIQALEVVVGAPTGVPRSPTPTPTPPRTQASAKSFVGLSLIDAATTHLQRTGHSLRTTEILGALQQGGVALTGKSPINSLGAVLNSNLKKGSALVRERRGVWALAAWHASRSEVLNGSRVAELDQRLGTVESTRPTDRRPQPPAPILGQLSNPASATAMKA